ncbi:EexN family lipoprotein [Bartonella australis]|uniref:EexN family lipoprotein n=1 Tax=Bartonella australis TaxID=388640 RepID=UPI0006880B6C|nr:EexN family lipoprotein [Bartonella australis]
MKKYFLMITVLLAPLFITACEKTYSKEEFKQNKTLRNEWIARCGWGGESKNCQNARLAAEELRQERAAEAIKRLRGESDESENKNTNNQ